MLPSDWETSLDPGIKNVVFYLGTHGFDTRDSGDGITKINAGWEPYTEALPYPHVMCHVDKYSFFVEAKRLQDLMPDWVVQADFDPKNEVCMLTLYNPNSKETNVQA